MSYLKPQKLVILGSTGSIGEQALEIVREHPDRFQVLALACNSSWEKLARQIEEFKPAKALLCNDSHIKALKAEAGDSDTEILAGSELLPDFASLDGADIVLNSLVGYAGFDPTVAALKADKKVALANKESLVVGGELINRILDQQGSRDLLVPVDSEHSAMLQCLVGEDYSAIKKLIITASGGPFRSWSREQMENITVEDALNHPNWSMGSKITVDSATMMNKGLEIIEAHWMFDLPLEKIEAVVHPQSIIHSVIEFVDGSSKAQLGPPTMKVPILYALTYPERMEFDAPTLDWSKAFDLNFEPVDYERFPCIRLARESIEQGGHAPAVLNAANEIAVERFLNKEIPYIRIAAIIEQCLDNIHLESEVSLNSLKQADQEARKLAQQL